MAIPFGNYRDGHLQGGDAWYMHDRELQKSAARFFGIMPWFVESSGAVLSAAAVRRL